LRSHSRPLEVRKSPVLCLRFINKKGLKQASKQAMQLGRLNFKAAGGRLIEELANDTMKNRGLTLRLKNFPSDRGTAHSEKDTLFILK